MSVAMDSLALTRLEAEQSAWSLQEMGWHLSKRHGKRGKQIVGFRYFKSESPAMSRV